MLRKSDVCGGGPSRFGGWWWWITKSVGSGWSARQRRAPRDLICRECGKDLNYYSGTHTVEDGVVDA